MVKNAPSSLRGSTYTLSLHQSQTASQVESSTPAPTALPTTHEATTHASVSTARLQDKNTLNTTSMSVPVVESKSPYARQETEGRGLVEHGLEDSMPALINQPVHYEAPALSPTTATPLRVEKYTPVAEADHLLSFLYNMGENDAGTKVVAAKVEALQAHQKHITFYNICGCEDGVKGLDANNTKRQLGLFKGMLKDMGTNIAKKQGAALKSDGKDTEEMGLLFKKADGSQGIRRAYFQRKVDTTKQDAGPGGSRTSAQPTVYPLNPGPTHPFAPISRPTLFSNFESEPLSHEDIDKMSSGTAWKSEHTPRELPYTLFERFQEKSPVQATPPSDHRQFRSRAAEDGDQMASNRNQLSITRNDIQCKYCRRWTCSSLLGQTKCINCIRSNKGCVLTTRPDLSMDLKDNSVKSQDSLGRQGPLGSQFSDMVGMKGQGESLITKGLYSEAKRQSTLKSPETYTQPFCNFLTENPTVWHAVTYFEKKLAAAGFKKLSERQSWTSTLEKGGKYYVSRNGSSLIAFAVGTKYKSGNGVAMVAGHVDALTARLKPVSTKTTKAGYVQLGVAPYAGALNSTWWDRDLGIGGRVLVKDGTSGKIETKLVKLGWPIARIPTLAPHFGVGMTGSNNAETEAVPIIGLDYSSLSSTSSEFENLTLGGAGSFTATQPPKLVRAIAGELSIQDYSSIVNWELELYDTQPAQVGGLEKEFIFAGRIDDKLCSWSAMEGLLASTASSPEDDGIVKLVGVFDDEEIGSLLRQGARGNFLPSTIERITESLSSSSSANILSQTYANSFLISADVTHAVNPNFLSKYLENHAPRLNVGLVVSADSNGHMTTDSISTALLTRVAEKSKSELQLFMIRNDSRSGGTVGPMLSSAMGVRAIDAGIPQLSMHSIRATTGALDPGLGVKIFKGFFDEFESVDKEFE